MGRFNRMLSDLDVIYASYFRSGQVRSPYCLFIVKFTIKLKWNKYVILLVSTNHLSVFVIIFFIHVPSYNLSSKSESSHRHPNLLHDFCLGSTVGLIVQWTGFQHPMIKFLLVKNILDVSTQFQRQILNVKLQESFIVT